MFDASALALPFVTHNSDRHDLHLRARTLQRKLGAPGTSYQALLDEVRRQAARNLLATTALDATEVAFLRGSVELNSFARAFLAWEGASPSGGGNPRSPPRAPRVRRDRSARSRVPRDRMSHADRATCGDRCVISGHRSARPR